MTPPYNEGDLNLVRGSEDLHAEASIEFETMDVEDPGANNEASDADYRLVQGCEDAGAGITFE